MEWRSLDVHHAHAFSSFLHSDVGIAEGVNGDLKTLTPAPHELAWRRVVVLLREIALRVESERNVPDLAQKQRLSRTQVIVERFRSLAASVAVTWKPEPDGV